MQQFRVAIAGFGGVGRATASLLLARRNRYWKAYGADVRLVAVCGSRAGLSDPDGLEKELFDWLVPGQTGPDFIRDSGANVLIEAGPSNFRTGDPGLAYIDAALRGGHDTIVVSKGALVHSGPTLRDLAEANNVMLRLSGAAAAALPTIDLLEQSLKGCEVRSIEGILNATTNFLLDSMTTGGIGFDTALEKAQSAGFTEADPRNDTEGWDTACKLLLISNFGLGTDLRMEDLKVEGIQSVTADRVADWQSQGLTPKLVGHLIVDGRTTRAGVEVRTFPPSDPFASVRGKDKAIRITTDAMGETIAIGSGTEPLATAAAALKDFEHILMARTS